jgi:hemoglobin-like flavoprotein
LNVQEIDVVQRTWRSVLPVGGTFAELFYGKLFSLDPALEQLFTDLKDQGRNLTAMISVVVGSLARPERIHLAMWELGRRHSAYGVKARHYELVRSALLWALEKTLGEAFTPEAATAWRAVYDLLARTMQDAGKLATGSCAKGSATA